MQALRTVGMVGYSLHTLQCVWGAEFYYNLFIYIFWVLIEGRVLKIWNLNVLLGMWGPLTFEQRFNRIRNVVDLFDGYKVRTFPNSKDSKRDNLVGGQDAWLPSFIVFVFFFFWLWTKVTFALVFFFYGLNQ